MEIKNVEQLRTERARLKMELFEAEQDIRDEIQYFSDRIRPVFNMIEFAKDKLSILGGGATKLALPLIIGKLAKGVKHGGKASVWGALLTLGSEYLLSNIQFSTSGEKISNFIGKLKKFNRPKKNK